VSSNLLPVIQLSQIKGTNIISIVLFTLLKPQRIPYSPILSPRQNPTTLFLLLKKRDVQLGVSLFFWFWMLKERGFSESEKIELTRLRNFFFTSIISFLFCWSVFSTPLRFFPFLFMSFSTHYDFRSWLKIQLSFFLFWS